MQIAKRSLNGQNLDNFLACPDPKNIFSWYYLIFGLKDCAYENGFYLGKISFPKEYPLKPPSIEMITPNGRFKEKTRICMSMSDYHPESWNPTWNVHSIIIGLISFMLSDENSTGCVITSVLDKKRYAANSLNFNLTQPKFNELFT
jgi:ubiquitin-conjugating enzyme E2 J2